MHQSLLQMDFEAQISYIHS